ncbi:GLUG motif-containing protein, partial [Clostridium minihomine]|uniref:GLUG motif-containing protein n=1 Tax=Clostridium minihomine TaxID=2045012 RepID=UPI0024373746
MKKYFKRNLKSLICVLVALSILISSMPLTVNAANISGTGTSSDPYIITSADQLASISTTGLGKCYKLGNNIDLSSYKDWTPIGNTSKPFTGTFDGDGYTISNLTIGTESSPSALSYLGLFGYTGTATIKNVGLKNASIYSTGDNIGGLVGRCNGNATITNTYITGNVSGCSYVGGLIGCVSGSNSVISNSYATAEVSGSSNCVGGLVGQNGYYNSNSDYVYGATVINCYANGSVAGSSYIGGLIGQSNGTITNSYAVGVTTGASYVGGLVGRNNNQGQIINSYAAGNVSGNQYVGGFIGVNYGKVTDSYWKTNAKMSGCASGSSTATEMRSAEMQTQTFADMLNANIDNLNLSGCIGW